MTSLQRRVVTALRGVLGALVHANFANHFARPSEKRINHLIIVVLELPAFPFSFWFVATRSYLHNVKRVIFEVVILHTHVVDCGAVFFACRKTRRILSELPVGTLLVVGRFRIELCLQGRDLE